MPAPQLHTHGVVFNMTQSPEGTWRSPKSCDLCRLQKELGGIYHQALAAEIVRLGYTISFAPNGTFEIDGVPLDVRQGFSSRPAHIEAALDRRGQSRAAATAAQKAVVALDTRATKQAVDQRQLVTAWRARADELGFTENMRRILVADAETRAAGFPVPTPRLRRLAADQAVAFAGQHLAEREAVFSMAVLERVAGDAGRGRVAHADILSAITRARDAENLVPRAVPRGERGVGGFATCDGIETEQRMLALEAGGRGTAAPLTDRIDAARIIGTAMLRSAEHGHNRTQGQRDVTRDFLLSPRGVTGIQGSAGTAKTTTMLATHARAACDRGLEVRALAPAAAAVLGKAIGTEHMTVARMLATTSTIACGERRPEVRVVDEANQHDPQSRPLSTGRAAADGLPARPSQDDHVGR